MASKTEIMAGGLGGKSGTKVSSGEKPTVHSMHVHKAKGGYVVHHFHHAHRPGMEPDEMHVVPHGPAGEGDLDNLHAHMEQHMGAPNAGESELGEGVVPGGAPAGGAAPPVVPPPAV